MDVKATVWHYLSNAREQVIWKVEGLPERDQRMPLTPTGTNLLGVVKHLAGVEAEYFGMCLGRPWPEPMAFWADDAEPNDDMWATAEESPEQILDLYRRVAAFADEGIEPLPLDAPAHVPWWQEPGHDPAPPARAHGLRDRSARRAPRHPARAARRSTRLVAAHPNLPEGGDDWWAAYVTRLRDIAEASG